MSEPPRSPAVDQAIQHLMKAMDSPTFRPPMLPSVAQDALRMSRDAGAELKAMAKLIEKDQALAVRFLAVANSSLYSRGVPALSVQAALTRLGLTASRDLLFFSSVEPFFFQSKQFATEVRAIKSHSLAVSAACAYLAKLKRLAAEDASLAGLVHDLGAAALLKYISDNKVAFEAIVPPKPGLSEVLGALHASAGDRLAQRWRLPAPLREVIVGHHQVVESSSMLVKLVAAADQLAALCGAGAGFDGEQKGLLESVLGDPSLLTVAVEGFKERIADIEKL